MLDFTFNFYAIPQLIAAMVMLFAGIFVLSRNPKSKINYTYFLTNISAFLWLIGYFFVYISGNQSTAIFWQKIVYVGVPFVPGAMYHFYIAFTGRNRGKFFIIPIYLYSLIFSYYATSTDALIAGVKEYFWGYYTVVNPVLYSIFLSLWVLIVLYVIVSFYFVAKKIKTKNPSKYPQQKYVSLAYMFASLAILDFLPAYGFEIYPWGYMPVIIFFIIVAYAIVRYRLMDIKLVLRKYSVYLSSLVTIILPTLWLRYLINTYIIGANIFTDLIIFAGAISLFTQVKDYYYRIANKYFFSSLYDAREIIVNLSERLKSTLELERIYHYITNTLVNAFHVKTISVFIFEESAKRYAVKYEVGNGPERLMNFQEEKGFYSKIIRKNPVIVLEELKDARYREFKKTIDLFIKNKIEVVVPLNVKDKVIGLLTLGGKESGDMYNDEDIEVLEIIGAQAAIAIENALLFEETRQFGLRLEGEVKKATKDLRAANVQLKKLDAAKSEFVSIASHQLRTPLTVIKGYISMMLEGNFGKIDLRKRDSLEKVYLSNERLIRLVENLLNISRIESGRLQFTFREMRLENLVVSVINELSEPAKEKGLKLEYAPPPKPLPKLRIDEEKIRQVVMNLVDNAIKYTKKGKVRVSVEQEDGRVKFSARDTGSGISGDDLARLFKKFSRGAGVSTVNTEGTGLGLYVAKEMIDAHGGHIWAESEGERKGSRFCFTLPVENNSERIGQNKK